MKLLNLIKWFKPYGTTLYSLNRGFIALIDENNEKKILQEAAQFYSQMKYRELDSAHTSALNLGYSKENGQLLVGWEWLPEKEDMILIPKKYFHSLPHYLIRNKLHNFNSFSFTQTGIMIADTFYFYQYLRSLKKTEFEGVDILILDIRLVNAVVTSPKYIPIPKKIVGKVMNVIKDRIEL